MLLWTFAWATLVISHGISIRKGKSGDGLHVLGQIFSELVGGVSPTRLRNHRSRVVMMGFECQLLSVVTAMTLELSLILESS